MVLRFGEQKGSVIGIICRNLPAVPATMWQGAGVHASQVGNPRSLPRIFNLYAMIASYHEEEHKSL